MRSDTNSSVRTLALPFLALQLRHLFLNFSPVYIVGTEGYRSLSIFWLKLNRYKLKLFSHDFMKKILILLLLLIVAIAIGWSAFNQEQPLSVTTITPEQGAIEAVIRVTGEVVNDRTVKMTALVDGQIKELSVRRGDSVLAGQVLTVFDRREADARLHKAEAELARERQAVAESYRKLKRLRDVKKSGGASIQVIDDAQAKWREATARLKVTEAKLEIENIHREKVEVRAPFAGVITEKKTEVGQWVEAGTALFTLVAKEGREIEVNVDAGDSAAIAPGQMVSISSDAWPDTHWEEKILRIAPAITEGQESALNTFAVRISLGAKAPSLLLGQQVDARVHTETRKDVMRLPFGALIEQDKASEVAVIVAGKVVLLPVKTGLEDFTHVEIISGLKGDETIILTEGQEFHAGQAVQSDSTEP